MNNINFFVIVLLLISCSNNKIQKETKLDVWESILQAVNQNNIDYLLEISADTLSCDECNYGESWIEKENFFRNHFEQMNLGRNDNYDFFVEDISTINNGYDKRYRINYRKEYKGSKYNIIYTILEGENGIQFNGVYSVP